MADDKKNEQFRYDRRLLDWYINTGHITRADYDKFLAQLPDLKNQAEYISVTGEKAPEGSRLN